MGISIYPCLKEQTKSLQFFLKNNQYAFASSTEVLFFQDSGTFGARKL